VPLGQLVVACCFFSAPLATPWPALPFSSPPTSSPFNCPPNQPPTPLPILLPQARALEAVGTLHNMPALEGALKLANHHRATALAERISAFIEQRLAMEAAAAELEQEDGYGDGEAAGRQVRNWGLLLMARELLWVAAAVAHVLRFGGSLGFRAMLHPTLLPAKSL